MVGIDFMNTNIDRSIKLGYDLDEGLFEVVEGTGLKGKHSVMINKLADAGKMLKKGDMVVLSNTGKYRVKKTTNNFYIGCIMADPQGEPPKESTDPKREASVEHVQPGEFYHLKLADDNVEITPGMYIVYDGSVFDGSVTKENGVVLIALEPASANSGKYIDVYCESIFYEAPETTTTP